MDQPALPLLLLVDDSAAVLDFEASVLGGTYRLDTAASGQDAWLKARALRPDAMLLDLSMPGMDGDELLKLLASDPALADLPVLVVSSEAARAKESLRLGARDYLVKPIRPDSLKTKVARLLEQDQIARRKRRFDYLKVAAGPARWALPLNTVVTVCWQAETAPLAAGAPGLREVARIHGEEMAVLDLAYASGKEHREPLADRKLVVVEPIPGLRLALCVDKVEDPASTEKENIESVDGRETLRLPGGRLQVFEAAHWAQHPRLLRRLQAPFI